MVHSIHLGKLPRAAFYAVQERLDWRAFVECDSLVLLPPRSTKLHDSGYRLMDAVACAGNDLLCRVSGCSDLFSLQAPCAIWTRERTPANTSANWGIDCLARSGLFRLFAFDSAIQVGAALSGLYLHPIKRRKEPDR